MSLTYDEVLTEAKIFARSYSQARLTFSKWRSYKTKVAQEPENCLSIHEIEDKTYALIYRPQLSSIEAFQFESILKRVNIKRNELIFKEIRNVWKLLNPFHLPGISKQVYVKFFEFLHFDLMNPNAPIEEFPNILRIDVEIDFAGIEVQGFMQFYDSLFENIDGYAHSMLVNEYCRIIKKLISGVKHSKWIKSQDLHTKMHSEGFRPQLPQWAQRYLKVRAVETQASTLRSNLLTPSIPSRFLERSARKEKPKDFIEVKLEKLTSPWNNRDAFKHKAFSPSKTHEYKYKKVRNFTSIFTRADNDSPLAKKLKSFKDKRILEDIIKDRSEKNSESKEGALLPLSFLNKLKS